ncbi:MAG: hypothetical protein QOH60_1177 [Mycobacterium sp.]|nr:hypothetical protein [Mycobacterium sp.]
MTRVVTVMATVIALMCAVVAAGIWLLVRHRPPQLPEISAYSNGLLTRTGPFTYCPVLDLTNCDNPNAVGELRVTDHYPVQLSVPSEVSRGLWVLLRLYDNADDNGEDKMRPGTLAATVPTVGPHGGRLDRIEVQLVTVARTPTGELAYVAHAVWSMAMVWPQPKGE